MSVKKKANPFRQLVVTSTIHGSSSTQTSAIGSTDQLGPENPAAHRPFAEDATSLALTITSILQDVAKTTEKLPYVDAIAGIVSQLLQIRQELQAHSKRCDEILEKVLRNGKVVLEQCAMLKGYREEGRLEPFFKQLQVLLEEVHRVLQAVMRRGFLDRFINRGLDELTELDRKIESFGRNVDAIGITQILAEIHSQRQTVQNAPGGPLVRPAFLLPPGPVRVVERDTQREMIVTTLLSSSNARVAVLGMGGIGKTTLACSAMRDPEVTQAYPRQLFISFEGLSTTELVYNSLANTFNIPTGSRTSNAQVLEQVKHYLGQEKTVICIDNYETFWEVPKNRRDADDFIGQVALISTLALIVTIRGTQGPGAVAWIRVGPLPPLTQAASNDLVQEITQGELGDSDSDPLQNLLAAVAGVPLAVTLVGNLLRDGSETPNSLWHRWNQESTRAIGMDVEDRQYRLDVSLKLSVFGPRMSDDSGALLAVISVLPSGLSSDNTWLDGFQALLPPSFSLRDCLRSLQITALCSLDKKSSPPRYQLLSPIRQFCIQNLPLDIEAIHKLIDLYIEQLYEDPEYNSSSRYTWFANELANITSILNFTFSLPYITDSLVYACDTYTRWMTYLGSPTTDIICKATDAQPKGSRAKAICFQSHANVLKRQGQNEDATNLLRKALSIHREVGDPIGEAWDLLDLGGIYRQLERLDDAESALNNALQLYKEQEDLQGEGNCMLSLANLYNDMSKFSEAESSAKNAIELYRSIGDRLGEANALNMLGWAYRKQGKVGLAIETSEDADRISREIKYTAGQALARYYLGLAHEDVGHVDQATSCLQESIRHFEKTSDFEHAQMVKVRLSQILSNLNAEAGTKATDIS